MLENAKKILIKTPYEKENVFEVFPLLHFLKAAYPESEINLLLDEENEYLFSFLEIEANFFVIRKEKRSLIGAHHFAANLNEVFNQDVFIDFEVFVLGAL